MNNFFEASRKQLGYILSLPERTLRSLAALVSGASQLLTDILFPQALKDTQIYRILIGDMQKFLAEKVAQVYREEQASKGAGEPGKDFLVRKMVGGTLETAGLLAMSFSPLWVFAIAGDVAGGSREYLDRLIVHLKRNGVLSDEDQADDLGGLLFLLQMASQKTASSIDIPPLSRQELAELADELKSAYGLMFARAVSLLPRLDLLWERMIALARREGLSVEQVSGIMTVDVAAWGVKSVRTALAAGQAGAELFGERILDGYRVTLDGIAREGAEKYLQGHMQPFLQAAAAHFNPKTQTWTEQRLKGGKPK